MTKENFSEQMRKIWDNSRPGIPTGDQSAEIAELRRRLEYAYRCIEYGFVHGVFDFSCLRTDASNYLADLEAAEAKARRPA